VHPVQGALFVARETPVVFDLTIDLGISLPLNGLGFRPTPSLHWPDALGVCAYDAHNFWYSYAVCAASAGVDLLGVTVKCTLFVAL
jgi:hypothetical protein